MEEIKKNERKTFYEMLREIHLSDKIQIFISFIMVLTLIFTIWTLYSQNDQYIIDNRPSVFISGWKDNTLNVDANNMNFGLKLFNVGRLPAKLYSATYKIKDGKNVINTENISTEIFIFPTQDNIFFPFIIPHQKIFDLIRNKGFNLEVSFYYCSLTDNRMNNKFYYLLEYNFPPSPDYPLKLETPHLNRSYAE